jgi:hypothetical protein
MQTPTIAFLCLLAAPPDSRQDKPPARPEAVAIKAGVEWLARQQQPDGSWKSDRCPLAATALAVMAFQSGLSTTKEGKYRSEVARGLSWLRSELERKPRADEKANAIETWERAIATMTLVEGYGLTRDDELERPARRAVEWLLAARNPDGGWGFRPKDGSSHVAVLPWCVWALVCSRDFKLIEKDADDACATAREWLASVLDESGAVRPSPDPASAKLRPDPLHPATSPEAIAAAGLLAAALMAHKPLEPLADRLIAPAANVAEVARADLQAAHLGSFGLFWQGGRHFAEWRERCLPVLLEMQARTGEHAGSWEPVGPWVEGAGRAYATALRVLSLRSYYRTTRIVR